MPHLRSGVLSKPLNPGGSSTNSTARGYENGYWSRKIPYNEISIYSPALEAIMTDETLSPTQKLAAEVNSLRSTINSLQDDIRLSNQRDQAASIDNQSNAIPQKISDLRTRGYAFGKGQEARAADLKHSIKPAHEGWSQSPVIIVLK
jgi:hypothetical protein